MLEELLEQFNKFFGENAHAVIVNGGLEITFGSKTAIFSLPEIPRLVGGRNEPMA